MYIEDYGGYRFGLLASRAMRTVCLVLLKALGRVCRARRVAKMVSGAPRFRVVWPVAEALASELL